MGNATFEQVVSLTVRAESALNEAKVEFKQQPKKRRTEYGGEASEWEPRYHQGNQRAYSGKVNSAPSSHTPQHHTSASRVPIEGGNVSFGTPSYTTCT